MYHHYVGDSSNSLYAMLNGQFFADNENNTAAFSYPLKGSGIIYQDKDTETKYKKRTLYMYNGWIPLITNGYNTSLFNSSNVDDGIVGYNPYHSLVISEKLKANKNIGRHYIGCSVYREYSSFTICKHVLFFYSTAATHYEMLNEMYSWNIQPKNIITMDGGGSAQIYFTGIPNFGLLELYGNTSFYFPDFRRLPNTISIYTR